MIAGIFPIYSWSFVKDVVFSEFLLNPGTLVGKIKSIYHFWDQNSALDKRWAGNQTRPSGRFPPKSRKRLSSGQFFRTENSICTRGIKHLLGGGFKHFLFSPLFGGMIQVYQYFSNGFKPTTRNT